MSELNTIGLRHGTDKSSSSHNYLTIVYESLLDRDAVRNVIEFGVYRGASLLTWRDWYPQAMVYGVDLRPNPFRTKKPPRVTFVQGDCMSPKLSLPGEVDLIVDDASHKYQDILSAFAAHAWRVRPGGFYVMEDIFVAPEIAVWIDQGGFPDGWKVAHRAREIAVFGKEKEP